MSGVSAVNTSVSGGTNSAAASTQALMGQLGPQAFLQLLTTQLANQDPLNPMDDTQSVAQLAQFAQLQASTNLESSFTSFQQNLGITQSAALLGHQVTASAGSTTLASGATTVTGTISTINVQNGLPSFTMVDSSGNPIVDTSGTTVEFPASQILTLQ